MKKYFSKTKGFTLIEVMIAVGLFVIVMVSGIGAVLAANTSHKKSQAQRQVIDTLSFVIEDMARNIRLGSNYVCPAGAQYSPPAGDGSFTSNPLFSQITVPTDCPVGSEWPSIAFEGQNGDPTDFNDTIAYIFVPDPNNTAISRLYKTTNNEEFYPITPAELELDSKSGFTVVGATPGPVDIVQPRVIIRLSGQIRFKDILTPFDIQTTVSQRLIDS